MTPIYPPIYNNLLCFTAFAVLASLVYRLVRVGHRSHVLLLFNLLFYTLCCGWYVILLMLTALWTYYAAQRMERSAQKRLWLIAGIVPSLSTLMAFKYATAVWTWLSPVDATIGIARILVPLGMSYYVLKAISYLMDVYKAKYAASTSIYRYAAYLTFFGQIMAGPIQRYDQWRECETSYKQDFASAYYLIVNGFFMKLVIAKRIGPYVLTTIAGCATVDGLNLWLGFLLYAVYIYCDFAGYSLLAIGVARLFGIHCPDNFRLPYFSANIREFWSRWHISLSSWLRDYIYIPLGGNRHGKVRRYANVLITFLVSGIWHGSTWNFVAWGGYHGVLNALSPKRSVSSRPQLIDGLSMVLTFLLVAFGWILFATPTLTDAWLYVSGMFSRTTLSIEAVQGAILPFTGDNTCLSHFLVAMGFVLALFVKEWMERFSVLSHRASLSWCWHVFILVALLLFGQFGSVSFIYAGF